MKTTIIKLYIILFCFFSSVSLFAQTPGDTDGTANGLEEAEPTAAPIDDYVLPMLLAAVYIGYRLTKRKAIHQI